MLLLLLLLFLLLIFSSLIWNWTLFQAQMSSGKFWRHENMPMYVSISMHMAVIWRIENQDMMTNWNARWMERQWLKRTKQTIHRCYTLFERVEKKTLLGKEKWCRLPTYVLLCSRYLASAHLAGSTRAQRSVNNRLFCFHTHAWWSPTGENKRYLNWLEMALDYWDFWFHNKLKSSTVCCPVSGRYQYPDTWNKNSIFEAPFSVLGKRSISNESWTFQL